METPPTVLFVLPALAGGGAERVMIALMNGLDRSRFSPRLLCVSDRGPLRGLVDPAIPFETLDAGGGPAMALPGLYRALKRIRPGIAVSTMAHMNFAMLALRPLFPRTAFIAREAITPSFFLDRPGPRGRAVAFCYRRLYPRADRIIAPARAVLDELSALLPGMGADRFVLIDNPVDEARVRAFAPVSLAPPDAVRFVASGRLHRQKGFDRLLDIMPALDMDFHLTILGEGTEREALTRQIEALGLGHRVVLAGHADAPWPYYAAADAFLLPSRREGMPNVVLEALACGAPAVAMAEAGGAGEIAARCSAVRLCADMDAFAAAMRAVRPGPRDGSMRPSLLPPEYGTERVMEAFADLLDDPSLRAP